ncbi:MAG: ribosome-associated toxin RatA of RatAB toxin-antitoxin module [Oceanicoccus sp.]|jgi:ribosome-associated toxin RatA of RatAB toxin-antitoxin module
MTDISRSALLPYAADKVYQLINDIAAYPQFMDGCVGSQVLREFEEEPGQLIMEARLDLAKAGFKHSFTTRNRLLSNRVEMSLVDGPFDKFSGHWLLLPLSDSACKVSLDLEFSLNSKVLSAATKALFNGMADDLVNALVKRAHHLYQ